MKCHEWWIEPGRHTPQARWMYFTPQSTLMGKWLLSTMNSVEGLPTNHTGSRHLSETHWHTYNVNVNATIPARSKISSDHRVRVIRDQNVEHWAWLGLDSEIPSNVSKGCVWMLWHFKHVLSFKENRASNMQCLWSNLGWKKAVGKMQLTSSPPVCFSTSVYLTVTPQCTCVLLLVFLLTVLPRFSPLKDLLLVL